MANNLCNIELLPSGKKVAVPKGSLLLDAAAKAGISIDTPCGGQGRCGRCLVKVNQGAVADRDNPHLTAQQLKEGWVLSCTARVDGDVSLTVPARKDRERITVETAATRAELPVQCEWPFFPAIRQLFVQMKAPSLDDNADDFTRLKHAVAKEGIDRLDVGLPMMQKLARSLREADWQVTLILHLQDHDKVARIIDVLPGKKNRPPYAVAVDIGTTNVVIDLVDLRSG
jgi:uncharacterized 2Fe-2S/4Fe-4S cluster protein (DUF4445 family)